MNVIVIGDRKTGKTSMVRALAEHGKYVQVLEGRRLANELYNPDTKEIAGTDKLSERGLTLQIDLPSSGPKELYVAWVDTPGELWSNSQLRKDYANAWEEMESKVCASRAIILLLPPHRELLLQHRLQHCDAHLQPIDPLPTQEQWVNRLRWWMHFFEQHCDRVKHILIGMNKADLFCNPKAEGDRWQYRPDRQNGSPWFDYNHYVSNIYFGAARREITAYKQTTAGSRTSFFITTTENRDLLELPWLYLGPYLAYS